MESFVEQIRSRLFDVTQFRVPPLRDQEGQKLDTQIRVESFEDFMLDASLHRDVLEQDYLQIAASVKALEDKWDAIEGWETLVDPADKTQKAVVNAKRKVSPELYDGIREGKWIADKIRTQIRRLEADEQAVSRAYTMATGG